jgi:hypothetical protein
MRRPPQLGRIALALLRKRDEAFEPAGVAPHPGETPVEQPTPEEVAELPLDEARETGAVGGSRHTPRACVGRMARDNSAWACRIRTG